MKERFKGLIAGVLIGSVVAGGSAFAAANYKTIDVLFDNIKIVIDGEEIEAKDANGTKVEPFVYNGTTYLPVRAVGNAIGKDVSWDGVEKVVYLGAKPGNTESWLDVCGPYQYTRGKEYTLEENKYFTMSGKKYTNGFTLRTDYSRRAEALFNLDGRFKSLTFSVGHIDGEDNKNRTLNIYLDGIIAYTTELKYDDVVRKITVPLNNALQMKIALEPGNASTDYPEYGFSEGIFTE